MRHSYRAGGVGLVALALALSACAGQPESSPVVAEGLAPEPGTEIPEVTVSVGLSPIGDGLIPVIGSRLGYFEDAGISFADGPEGLKTDLLGALTPLLNNQIEIGVTYMPLVTPQLDSVDSVTSFAFPTTFHGTKILAPEGEYETLSDAMAAGESFEEAAPRIMEQLRGQSIVLFTGADPAFYDLALETAGMSLADLETSYLGDPDMVTAAISGQADFVSPNGAVQISQLEQSGWEPLIEITDLIEAMPEETLGISNTQTGFVTTDAYAAENYNTILRFTSVLFRIVADLEADPLTAASTYVDYVNAYTGSSMTAEDAARLFTAGLYTLNPFEEYANVVSEPGTGSNYYESTQAQIERLVEQGVLQGEHSSDDASIAERVYTDLDEYRNRADELLSSAPDGELKTQAQVYYDQYNYLDAYRYALEASGGE